MSDYNYIITVDENGSPCLSHALFGGGGNAKGSQRANHKYYARAQDKGRWRYFYSPEEFRAWSSGGIKKAKKAAGNAADEVRKSINARRELNEANKATGFGSGLKQWNAQRKYNKTAMGKAEQELRKKASDLKTDVQSKAEDVEIAANKASRRAQKKFNDLKTDIQSKAEDVEIAANKASKQAKKKIKNLTDAVQEHGNKALSELRKAAGNAGDKARDTATGALKKVNKALGGEAYADLQNANFLNRGRRQKAYDATPMGKVEKAAKNVSDRARDAAEEAGDRARDVADRVRDKASNIGNKARDAVREATGQAAEDRWRESFHEAYGNNKNPFTKNARRQKERDVYEEYQNSPKGRMKNAVLDVEIAAQDIRKGLRNLANSAASSAQNVAGRARDAASNAASKAQNAVGEATGTNAKKEMDAAGRRAMMGLDDAIGSFVDAQARYDNSAAGRTASAKSNAQASLKAAQSAAKKALAKAMDYLPEEQIEEIKDLIRGK